MSNARHMPHHFFRLSHFMRFTIHHTIYFGLLTVPLHTGRWTSGDGNSWPHGLSYSPSGPVLCIYNMVDIYSVNAVDSWRPEGSPSNRRDSCPPTIRYAQTSFISINIGYGIVGAFLGSAHHVKHSRCVFTSTVLSLMIRI